MIFLHNPKAGGTSLGKMLNVKRRSHTYASQRLTERQWKKCFSIVVVREPFDRFLSGYFARVIRPGEGALDRMYGPVFKTLDAFQYLDVILDNPKFGGMQTNWTDFPSQSKPQADLVLKFEDIDKWMDQIRDAGLQVDGRELPHQNKGPREAADPWRKMNMTESAYDDLRIRVAEAFLQDYETFDYPLPEPALLQAGH